MTKHYLMLFFHILYHIYDVKAEQNLPLGHGLELGRHRPSEGHIEVLTNVPEPQIFWEKYAKKRIPVLFRGAAKDFPSMNLWTDSYLKDHFGDLELKLEAKKEKDKTPTGEKGLGRDTLRNYLDNYKRKDSYVVSQLPDPMAKDINVLSCLSCGTFSKHILEANLWLSSGGTSSLLHRDADNAINCLLNGTKDWILINPGNEKNIPIAQGDSGYGGFAVLDVNNVNLLKYPAFQNVPWHYANITPGDCLFLPFGYWHQVRSYGSKNMAVSVLFSRLKEFSSSGCDKGNYKSFPLSNSGMVWTYPGYGPQTLGNSDPFEFRDMLVNLAEQTEEENQIFDRSTLFKELVNGNMLDGEDDEMRPIADIMYTSLYNFTHGEITKTTINNLTTEQLKTLVLYLEPDPANTEEYEYDQFSPGDISETIEKAMDIDHGELTQTTLIQQHMIAGGSEKLGQELFTQMDLNSDGVVNQEEMTKTIDELLIAFKKEIKSDDSFDYYMQQLQEDKKMMENKKKNHEEL